MDRKSFFEKIISFKMKSIIDHYKCTKQDREFMKMDIELIKNNKSPRKKYHITNLFLILTLVLSIFFSIPFIFDNTIRYEDKIIIPFFSFFVGCLIAIRYKNIQCNYVLNEFRKIEESEQQEKENFKKKISACNLYMK